MCHICNKNKLKKTSIKPGSEREINLRAVAFLRVVFLPAAAGAEPLVFPGGGALRGLKSWTGSFGAGSEGVDSISKNFTNISEKDWNNREL